MAAGIKVGYHVHKRCLNNVVNISISIKLFWNKNWMPENLWMKGRKEGKKERKKKEGTKVEKKKKS